MIKSFTLFLIANFFSLLSFAQVIGNQVYKNRYDQNSNNYITYGLVKPVIVKDSILLISADVLLNVRADSLVVTLGLSEEAKTVKEANTNINKRINAFRTSLKQIGIAESDAYVDFIAQTKVFDYAISGSSATQFIKGFEIKKNIIVRMNAAAIFEKVIELASENGIYDLVKVDYVINSTQKIYAEMMAAAATVAKQKKDVYFLLSPVELLPVPKLVSETFTAIYPNKQYKEYQAYESSDVTADYSNARLIKKEERKAKTFYYDKIDQSQFDLILNNASPVVGIQFVLQIQLQYELKHK